MANFTSSRKGGFRRRGQSEDSDSSIEAFTARWAMLLDNDEVSRALPKVAHVISVDDLAEDEASYWFGGTELDTVDMQGKTAMTLNDIYSFLVKRLPKNADDPEVWTRADNGASATADSDAKFSENTDRLRMTLWHKLYVDVVIATDNKVIPSDAVRALGNVFFSVRIMIGGKDGWPLVSCTTPSWQEFVDKFDEMVNTCCK